MATLDGFPVILAGAHATAVYAPERNSDVYVVVPADASESAEAALRDGGWTKQTYRDNA
jgi:hypothetical protein